MLPKQDSERTHLSAEGTTWAIYELVNLLSDIRNRSDPSVFESKWNAEIGRLHDLEQVNVDDEGEQEVETETEMANMTVMSGMEPDATSMTAGDFSAQRSTPICLHNQSGPQIPDRQYMTPTATAQTTPNPAPQQTHNHGVSNTLSVQHKSHITVQISTSDRRPSTSQLQPYYTWPSAPCSTSDRAAFFAGITARIHLRPIQIRGYTLGFSWSDVSFWIDNSLDDMERGWEGVQGILGILKDASRGHEEVVWKDVSVRVLVLRK